MSEREANTDECFMNDFMEGLAAIIIYSVCLYVCVSIAIYTHIYNMYTYLPHMYIYICEKCY